MHGAVTQKREAPRGFWVAAREEPERVALVDADGQVWTAGELLVGANQLVHALRARGVKSALGRALAAD